MNRVRSARLVIALALAAATACTSSARMVTLVYPPPTPQPAPEPAQIAGPSSAPERASVVLVTFADRRPNRAAVGKVEQGWGSMASADVVASNDVVGWVMDAIARDLARSGLTVERADGPLGDGRPVISGQIRRVFAEALFLYEAEVILDVTVRRANQELLRRPYAGAGRVGLNWIASPEGYAEALSLALESAIRGLSADLLPALEGR
jgi:hypothetical protein